MSAKPISTSDLTELLVTVARRNLKEFQSHAGRRQVLQALREQGYEFTLGNYYRAHLKAGLLVKRQREGKPGTHAWEYDLQRACHHCLHCDKLVPDMEVELHARSEQRANLPDPLGGGCGQAGNRPRQPHAPAARA